MPRLRIAQAREAGAAREDGRNVVVLRTDRWCPTDSPAFGCYSAEQEAITHVRPYPDAHGAHAGEIREADIEINAIDFRWSLDGATRGTRSLRAVLGHELGHILGLAHSCSNRGAPSSRPSDVPFFACDATRSASIMYPDPTAPGRPLVLFPGPDAIAGLCRAPHSSASPP